MHADEQYTKHLAITAQNTELRPNLTYDHKKPNVYPELI